jgi:hypothetical protein
MRQTQNKTKNINKNTKVNIYGLGYYINQAFLLKHINQEVNIYDIYI